ncbi:sugar transferase [Paenibacillus sp. tmac-D7]|uniref:sugar transferase n=1 Tax=Paenibacillus sp. tmac-D7 TaxID=2591462 RepID=UPI001142AFC0|nr:sugar transferase [Paenibacillus sp. tmac-D7]
MESVTRHRTVEEQREVGSEFYLNYVKASTDLIGSFVLILITLPVMFLVAVLIKVESEGPIVFRQWRIGKNGKPFVIYKFRSMLVHSPKEGRSPETCTDPRVTKVGRFIRKTSLDELPQLFNIIKGDMSFIGPRPEQQSFVERYYPDKQHSRFLVKPGITGLWQISQDRKKPIYENLHHDLIYVRSVSIWLDLKIIIRTLRVMIKSNTY